MTVKVRIAPSPTGDPHVGTAYIALFNYAFARHHGGRFVLRIEDTDQTRSTRASEEAILRSLKWLGLTWDEGPDVGGPCGPYRQSERSAIYREHAEQLVASGGAYRCFCTAERLAEVRAEQKKAGRDPKYDGHCRDLSEAEVKARLGEGLPYVVRLKMPREGVTQVPDGLRGEVPWNNSQMDDQVLLKSDGFPTYHLANVVDDHLMGITHVIRAEEWIASTPKHLRLYELFGWERPAFYHMPLLRNADRSKISKRKNPTSLDYYLRAGFLPEAMLNFLALMGWSMPEGREIFTLEEMVRDFSWERISLGGPVFDVEKLTWLNGMYIRALPQEELLKRVFDHVLNRDYVASLLPHVQPRINRLDEFIDQAGFFFNGALEYAPGLIFEKYAKRHAAADTRRILTEAAEKLDALKEWSVEALEATLRAHAEEHQWKPGDLFMAVRVVMTGRMASPPLFETMQLLGRPICQYRLRDAIEKLKPLAEAEKAAAKAPPKIEPPDPVA
jgi:glutamyl-tRNA synthetase